MQAAPVTASLPVATGNAVQSAGVENGFPEGLDFSALLKAQIKGGLERSGDAGTGFLDVASARETVAKTANVSKERLALVAGAMLADPGVPSADVTDGSGIAAATGLVEQVPASVSQEMPVADPVALEVAAEETAKEKLDARHQAEVESERADGLLPSAGIFIQPAAAVTTAAVALPRQARPDVLAPAPAGRMSVETLPASGPGDGKGPDSAVGRGSPNPGALAAAPGRQAEFAADGKNLPQAALAAKDVESLAVQMHPSAGPQHNMPDNSFNSLSPAMMVASHAPLNEVRAAPASQNTLQVPVGASGWGDALGQKVVWMAGQQTQVAELHLNPPNLGPMEVRLSISNDQISAMFVSHQPAVREAIEAAMPRLREMLADSGMSLGNATVSSDSLPQQQFSDSGGRPGHSRQSDFPSVGNVPSAPNSGGVISLRHDGRGMVDLFA